MKPSFIKNHTACLLGGIAPVSYTHLDVYKRQVMGSQMDESRKELMEVVIDEAQKADH